MGWVTINGAHVFIKGGKVTKGPRRLLGAGTKERAHFNLLQQRLVTGGFKRGERRLVEKRAEALAKRIFKIR
mgnify:FL=1